MEEGTGSGNDERKTNETICLVEPPQMEEKGSRIVRAVSAQKTVTTSCKKAVTFFCRHRSTDEANSDNSDANSLDSRMMMGEREVGEVVTVNNATMSAASYNTCATKFKGDLHPFPTTPSSGNQMSFFGISKSSASHKSMETCSSRGRSQLRLTVANSSQTKMAAGFARCCYFLFTVVNMTN